MLVLLVFIIVFHITSAALLFIATIDNAWWVGEQSYSGLWKVCGNISGGLNCTDLGGEVAANHPTLQAVQVSMILATTLCCMAFLVFLLQLFRLKQGDRFVLTAILQLLSCLCVMIAASIYTDQGDNLRKNSEVFRSVVEDSGVGYGYSFVLAWVAFAFTLLSSLMYLVLRKRK